MKTQRRFQKGAGNKYKNILSNHKGPPFSEAMRMFQGLRKGDGDHSIIIVKSLGISLKVRGSVHYIYVYIYIYIYNLIYIYIYIYIYIWSLQSRYCVYVHSQTCSICSPTLSSISTLFGCRMSNE